MGGMGQWGVQLDLPRNPHSFLLAFLQRRQPMDTARISSKGQIVIPKAIRDAHRIRTGDRFTVYSVGNELRLKPVEASIPTSLKEVAGMLHQAGRKKVSDAEIERRIARQLLAEDAATKSP
jgi:AbrB family looped-hinge helix DNA binding protein